MKDLAIIETILRNRHHFFNEIREGIGLPEKMRAIGSKSTSLMTASWRNSRKAGPSTCSLSARAALTSTLWRTARNAGSRTFPPLRRRGTCGRT
jgi:hypothetical protein